MAAKKIHRPEVYFEPEAHSYHLEGVKLPGISTVAKIGETEAFSIGSWWGWRLGYEGALSLMQERSFEILDDLTNDNMRAGLKRLKLTPNDAKQAGADKGNWAHDFLEELGQKDEADLEKVPLAGREHARGVLRFYLAYRPKFIALEVQVTSKKYGFAGRYDVRCWIEAKRLLPLFEGHDSYQQRNVEELARLGGEALCLIDLKTSKGVYPTTHFSQLSGYEIGSSEMGFLPTHAQFVLHTKPDGTFELAASWSTPQDFIAYLTAERAITRIKAADPTERVKANREGMVLSALPGTYRDVATEIHLDHGIVLGLLKSMQKRKLVKCVKGVWNRKD